MFGVSAYWPVLHRRLRGAFFSLISTVVVLALLASCRSTPAGEEPVAPPLTGIVHYDTALAIAFRATDPVRSSIYVEVASGLAQSGEVARAIAVLDLVAATNIETALLLSRGWNRVAAVDEDYVLDAFRADERVLEFAVANEDTEARAADLLRLLAIQLGNDNRSIESIRAAIDELYFLADDAVRAGALVDAAELIRGAGERGALTAVVQQAIAVLPSLEEPFLASTLSARLAELSRTIGRPRDTQMLIEGALNRAEAGLFVTEEALPDLGRLVGVLARLDGASAAAIVVENVTPRSYRALAYAELGAALAPAVTADRYFEEAFTRAAEIADRALRARTETAVILARSAAQPAWSPEVAAAAVLQRADLPNQPEDVRLEVITGIGTAYYLSGHPEAFTRLRGLIASSTELGSLTVAIASELYDRGRIAATEELLEQIEPTPETLIGFLPSSVLTAADLVRRLGLSDSTVRLLASAVAAEVISSPEAAVVIARIPADYRPDPATVSQLQRIEEE